MGKNVMIVGASGMIGNELLTICLNSDKVSKVTSLVRRKSSIDHLKLQEIVVADFNHYESIVSNFKTIDVVFYCLGVYTGAVGKEEFRKITVDYPVNLAKSIYHVNPNIVFCLLSGQGADRSEKSIVMFAKDKGAAENQLSALGFNRFYAFRPGYIYPSKPRQEPNFSYKVFKILYPLIKLLGNNMSVKSEQLAQVMFQIAFMGIDKEVLENRDIVAWFKAHDEAK